MRIAHLGVWLALGLVALAACTDGASESGSSDPDALDQLLKGYGHVTESGPSADAVRHVIPGLAPAEVRGLLGEPLKIARRVPPTARDRVDRFPFFDADPLPPIAPGGDDWAYTHARTTSSDDGDSITNVKSIKVSFGADGKVVDCRFIEYYTGEGTQLLNSIDPYGERHCSELRD